MQEKLSQYDVVWDTPAKDASGSMPLGNGDFALNVWVEESGDVVLLLAKSDAWDENSILLKLGRVRLRFDPPYPADELFQQRLHLQDATIEITLGTTRIRLWVDAHAPTCHVEVDSSIPLRMTASLELWRTTEREVKPQTGDLFCNLTGKPLYPTIISPDVVFPAEKNRVMWCHHNAARGDDPYVINMILQGLDAMLESQPHPLLHRTFGGAMEGDGLQPADDRTLHSAAESCTHHLRIHALTQHPASPQAWREKLIAQIEDSQNDQSAFKNHLAWWKGFRDRSWIFLASSREPESAFQITRAYILQRFMNACAGRGEFPIKHNGSLFSVGRGDDPDFRRWGGAGYWFMNQRLIYWPMLMAGDFDLIEPWLKMYLNSLPLQKLRTQTYFAHAGAHFPETITFWGSEISSHYGWTPFANRKRPEAECPYLTYYWSGAIELILFMMEYALFKSDASFARQKLAPFAREILTFFDQHYPRDGNGKIRFEPAQALETWHEAVNPLPEIAGLRYVLSRLLNLPAGWISTDDAAAYQRLLTQLPELPVGEIDGTKVILPAQSFDRKKNRENPELYCIFPYRIFGVTKPDLQLAKDTFSRRLNISHTCWSQDDIQMSLLGMSNEVQQNLIHRASDESYSDSRFPAFWDAFSDWVPDIDHGGVLQLALQFMLMQCEGEKILLLPAWPDDWDAEFKLHAPLQTVVEGVVRRGKIVRLTVSPAERLKDVEIFDPRQLP